MSVQLKRWCTAVLEQLDRPLVVVDFDRTLCSTRSGADPTKVVNGKAPVADEALVELLGATPAGAAFVASENEPIVVACTMLVYNGFAPPPRRCPIASPPCSLHKKNLAREKSRATPPRTP